MICRGNLVFIRLRNKTAAKKDEDHDVPFMESKKQIKLICID
ncbi:hypothetical protein CHCC20488_2431 [Bacillus paralicheniformis]|uniref:Uncharacterized protein n=1 Tax=Bacillus paralicheniformis TaxID=1648923 RepID=A0A7Z0WX43_9BACI|nr:hypothetical protein B4121_2789 [Bacillus paralicheniformis]TWJ61594.1 hypothetical protein CHCC5022_3688 [Bacillus paralicheniformis]TWJ74555.1 hypothetical protein CHCC20497_3640 [Bacillus paralicheniformis]TWJ81006.1 hypothetical protein CHCC4186_0314 [Bacillus paralicheniformis]TWN44875.1 hypothetical protein CHCC14523_2534 [Bacillus paralicheniformis]